MPVLAVSTALMAAVIWSAAYLVAHGPVKTLGSFESTRIQLIFAAALLLLVVSVTGGWETVAWTYWPWLIISSLIGVLLGNLVDFACMRRGGPRRLQLFLTLNAPIAALIGYVYLGEVLGFQALIGCVLTLLGVVLAILYGGPKENPTAFEELHGPFWVMAGFGLLGALFQALGLVALKPVLTAGTDPLAASALRTGGAAFLISLVALWPSRHFRAQAELTPMLLFRIILPGFMGYVLAVSLLLYALSLYHTGVVAVLASTVPVLMLPLIWARTKICPPAFAWIGAAIAVAGVGLIVAA